VSQAVLSWPPFQPATEKNVKPVRQKFAQKKGGMTTRKKKNHWPRANKGFAIKRDQGRARSEAILRRKSGKTEGREKKSRQRKGSEERRTRERQW